MPSDSNSVLTCVDCGRVFEKRMHYNRHRKNHDRPYPCYLCGKKFSLKTGLERHKSAHQATAVKFRCKVPSCKTRGYVPLITARKDYLWDHMGRAHGRQYNDKELRKLYNEAVSTAKVSHTDERGLELFWAIREGDEERVGLLISQNASTKVTDDRGLTAFHMACEIGNITIVDLFIGKGADVNAKARYGDSPLHCATRGGHTSIVKLLLENGANPNSEFSGAALGNASRLGMIPMLEQLIVYTADADGNRWTSPLEGAAYAGKLESVKILLDHGADLKGRENGPLCYAVEEGHFDVVKLLLDRGADPMAISDSDTIFSVDRRRSGGTSEQILQLLIEAHSKNLVREETSSPPTCL